MRSWDHRLHKHRCSLIGPEAVGGKQLGSSESENSSEAEIFVIHFASPLLRSEPAALRR